MFHGVESVEWVPPQAPQAKPMGVIVGHRGEIELVEPETGRVRQRYNPPYGAILFVKDGEIVEDGTDLFEWDAYSKPVVTEVGGTVKFVDVKDKRTVRDEVDEVTGLKLQVIMEDKDKELQPAIDILDAKGKKTAHYPLPTGSRLQVLDGDIVVAGQSLVKIRRESSKTRDITGGLPRVSELFEARRPRDAATVSEIDGRVRVRRRLARPAQAGRGRATTATAAST